MQDEERKRLNFTIGNKGSSNVRVIDIVDYKEEHFDSLIQIASSCYDFYACIIHDKDDNESGKHIHLVCYSKGGTSLKAHCNNFESVIPSNFVERGKSIRALCRYLIHLDNPDKFQYSPQEVFTNDLDRFYTYINECHETSSVWKDYVLVKSSRMSIDSFLDKYRAEFSSMPFYQKVSLFDKLYDYFGGANHVKPPIKK